jgi:hypothetical protein
LVVCDGMIVDLFAGSWLVRVGAFSIFMFSDLSSPLIYPPGPMRWSERQVLVDVGREHANVIFFAYNYGFRNYSLKRSETSPNQSGDSW